MADNLVIEVKGLSKTYKKGAKAVDNLNLIVKEGEIILFNNKFKNKIDVKRNIGLVTQEVCVFEQLNVIENVTFFCGLYINDKATRDQSVKEAIELVQTQDYIKYKPSKFSGGLLRRLHIACGIAHKLKLIFFD